MKFTLNKDIEWKWFSTWQILYLYWKYLIVNIFVASSTYIVKPLTVQIVNPPTPLVADRRYEVACESAGSRPNAIITWYKGKRQLRRTKVSKYIYFLLKHYANIQLTEEGDNLFSKKDVKMKIRFKLLYYCISLEPNCPPYHNMIFSCRHENCSKKMFIWKSFF